jgi:hypothetical protein
MDGGSADNARSSYLPENTEQFKAIEYVNSLQLPTTPKYLPTFFSL